MATLWIIDAYNFIRSSRRFGEWEAESPEAGKQAALAWLGDFSRLSGEQLWLVFDAYSRIASSRLEQQVGALKIIESRGAYTADEEIIELAKQYAEAAIVVSSDREVLRGAVRARASILTAQEFEREVGKVLAAAGASEDRGAERRTLRGGQAFRPPKEKKKAYQRLRKYQ